MIAVDTPTIDALSAPGVRMVLMIEFALDGNVFVRYAAAGHDVVWDGKTWTGMGAVLSVAPITESSNLEAVGWTIGLSGVPSDLLSLAAQEIVVGRRVTAWIAVYTEAGALVGTPFKKFEGAINDMTIEDDPTDSRVTVRVESRLIWLLRAKATYWTNAEQKRLYPTDDGFKFTDITAARTLKYGPRV